MMVDVNVCRESDAVQTLLALCEKYGGGDVVLNSDERLTALGIPAALEAKYTCHTWSPETAQDNISFSEKLILVWFMQNMVWRKLAESSYSLAQIVDVQ